MAPHWRGLVFALAETRNPWYPKHFDQTMGTEQVEGRARPERELVTAASFRT